MKEKTLDEKVNELKMKNSFEYMHKMKKRINMVKSVVLFVISFVLLFGFVHGVVFNKVGVDNYGDNTLLSVQSISFGRWPFWYMVTGVFLFGIVVAFAIMSWVDNKGIDDTLLDVNSEFGLRAVIANCKKILKDKGSWTEEDEKKK
ncbi:MAG: hypothetical protein WC516_06810 [Patescibacteria group bacterium]|jgi:hypothetical protein